MFNLGILGGKKTSIPTSYRAYKHRDFPFSGVIRWARGPPSLPNSPEKHPEVLEIKKGMEFKAKKPTEVWGGFFFGGSFLGNVEVTSKINKEKRHGGKHTHTHTRKTEAYVLL